MNILLGKEEHAFDEYSKYNTNIGSYEIFGIEKNNFENNIYEFFMNKIKK